MLYRYVFSYLLLSFEGDLRGGLIMADTLGVGVLIFFFFLSGEESSELLLKLNKGQFFKIITVELSNCLKFEQFE